MKSDYGVVYKALVEDKDIVGVWKNNKGCLILVTSKGATGNFDHVEAMHAFKRIKVKVLSGKCVDGNYYKVLPKVKHIIMIASDVKGRVKSSCSMIVSTYGISDCVMSYFKLGEVWNP